MPIYEYQCQSCKEHIELLQKISDEPATKCPKCKKNKLKKMVSAAGFRLKGSGWYETDFKSGKKKNVVGGNESSSSASSSATSASDSSS